MPQTHLPELDALNIWLNERPKWLQTAAARLHSTSRSPTNDELEKLADLCHNEVSKKDELIFENLPHSAFIQPSKSMEIRIENIEKICGINAIQNQANLNFQNKNMTVIYGANGVGKTGFSRLLKHACGAKQLPELLQNVFHDATTPASASFNITHNGNPESINWTYATGSLSELKHVHVFDSMTATNYVNSKNEASYETRRLRFISHLIAICDQVNAILQDRSQSLVRLLPSLPVELGNTASAIFLQNLKSKTTLQQIDAACLFSPDEFQERITLEGTIAETKVDEKLLQIRKQKEQLDQLRGSLTILKDGFSIEKFEILLSSKFDATTKRKAATDAAQKAFTNAPLEGIGEESWRLLWEQARSYSEQLAYPQQIYPVVNEAAHCVLCQQPLSGNAKERLVDFEIFIKGNLEAEAKTSEKKYAELINAFPVIPTLSDWQLKLHFLQIDPIQIDNLYTLLVNVCNQVPTINKDIPIIAMDWDIIRTAIITLKNSIGLAEKALIDVQDVQKRAEMIKHLADLKGKEWLSQQKPLIVDEVKRLIAKAEFDSACKLANTKALSTKKTELIQDELASGYQERFAQELLLLGGGRIPVEPIAISEGKGKIKFQLSLKGNKHAAQAHKILSEGENRIVALAAFLADINSLGFPTPFVFDDPISSLDQDFEERVVARLIEMAKTRQVIIFTHRLSLVTLLESAQESISSLSMSIEMLKRIGPRIGVTDKLNIREKQPKQAFNTLKESLIPIRKLETAGNINDYETRMKATCSDFRITIEKTVETVLLNKVTLRFRRDIQTKGRLAALTKITLPDCSLVDGMMTKFSCFEHSQSQELPTILPTVDELEADIVVMLNWIDEFSKRDPKT